MNQHAHHAIRAAKNRYKWGRYAARRYTEKRGVPAGLYRLACQLAAGNKAVSIRRLFSLTVDTSKLESAIKRLNTALQPAAEAMQAFTKSEVPL